MQSEYPLTIRELRCVPWRQPPDSVSLGGAKADSPSPRDGRNIRFLEPDLAPFRATFQQEVENATTTQA